MPNPIVMCMGTRPEIIKMAPVYRALREASLPVALLHTGQHEEMAWPLYAFFGMRPERAIALERKSDALAHLNALLLSEIHTAFESLKPSAVLVHGDTSSALAAAQAATIRLKLLKVGVRVCETARRVWLHLSSAYPLQPLWFLLLSRLRAPCI